MWNYVDSDGKGYLSLDDFTSKVLVALRMANEYNPGVLKSLWKLIDKDGHDEVTWRAFALGMYRIVMATWPEMTPHGLARLVSILEAHAETAHSFRGNWYLVTHKLGWDGHSMLSFCDVMSTIRHPKPGLHVAHKDISDEEIRALWRAADNELEGSITVNDFVRFMRYNQAKTAGSDTKKGGSHQSKLPTFTKSQLRSIAVRLNKALGNWMKVRGHPQSRGTSSLADQNLQWCILLSMTDTDKSDRVEESEFLLAVRHVLEVKENYVSDLELKVYFSTLDTRNGRSALTAEDFALAMYRNEVDYWPFLHQTEVERLVHIMGDRVIHWHFANTTKNMAEVFASWFKLLSAQNVDSHRMGALGWKVGTKRLLDFNEFVGMIRCPRPGLSITTAMMSDDEVRGLWKIIDVDRLGRVSFDEFMRFFRMNCHNQGTCGGPVLLKSNRQADLCPAEILAVQHLEKQSQPKIPLAVMTAARKEAEAKNRAKRQNWSHHVTGSASSCLKHDDALRYKFHPTIRPTGACVARPPPGATVYKSRAVV
eukprot:TRINITY_DN14453_c0_g1_i2.p1 TRINITY_DN14453_c0_g1~~TRINITY_DN14453_c0_g1_i2.p1  ORF type:complete len:620 (-),score=56.72 TRINITY_DN14453_c0_g1_i2:147-1757(-)